MKKNIISILLILFLTGCKVEYTINLDNSFNIEENAKLTATTESVQTQMNEFFLNVPIDKEVDDIEAFEKKLDNIKYYNLNKNQNELNFSNKYNNDNYQTYINSTLVNMAYEDISISEVGDKELVLSTSKEFLLFDAYEELDEVKVIINTNYKVLSNNADEINNHSYTWIITKDNAYGKSIYLKIDTTKEALTFLEKLLRGDYLNIFTLSLIILLIGYLIYKFLKKKSNKINEI